MLSPAQTNVIKRLGSMHPTEGNPSLIRVSNLLPPGLLLPKVKQLIYNFGNCAIYEETVEHETQRIRQNVCVRARRHYGKS
jgi:hypothetical protein